MQTALKTTAQITSVDAFGTYTDTYTVSQL